MPELKGSGFELLEIGVRRKHGDWTDIMRVDDDIEIVVKYRLTKKFDSLWLTMHLKNESGEKMFSTSGGGRCYDKYHESGEYEQVCMIPANFLNWGNYAVDLMAVSGDGGIHHLIGDSGDDIVSFSLENREVAIGGWMYKEPGDITPKFEYTEQKLK